MKTEIKQAISPELYIASLTKQKAELEAALSAERKKAYEKEKQLEQQIILLRDSNRRLTEENCTWTCVECQRDLYGPAPIEKASLKCPFCSKDALPVYCIPKKLIEENQKKAA